MLLINLIKLQRFKLNDYQNILLLAFLRNNRTALIAKRKHVRQGHSIHLLYDRQVVSQVIRSAANRQAAAGQT